MRAKIVLGRPAVPKRVRLPNGTSFVARYERTSRKNSPGNIRVTRTVEPRNKRQTRVKKRVRFSSANTLTQDRARRIKKKKKKRKKNTGECNLVKD